MFLDLPTELQHDIYDQLQADDRMRLNQALPKNARILKTTRTNAEKDRRLAVLAYSFRRGLVNPGLIPIAIVDFMKSDMEDPTVREICTRLDIKIDDVDMVKARVLGHVQAGALTKAHCLDLIAPHVHRHGFVDDVLNEVAACGSPAMYDTVMGVIGEHLCGEATVCAHFVFAVVNYNNERLLYHVCDVQRGTVFIERSMAYMRHPDIARIFACTPVKVDLMLRYCGLDGAAIEAILGAAVAGFHADTVIKMVRLLL